MDYPGVLGKDAMVYVMEVLTPKGGQNTTECVKRYALRHRGHRCCAIGALAEVLYTTYHLGDRPRTLDCTKTIKSHDYAKTRACSKLDSALMLKAPCQR